MGQKFQSFPGMEDILPKDVVAWQWLENKTRVFFETYGYREIRTPILEPTQLFSRSIGETSDIVHKEMYTFEDRGERSMTMRPEMTASVARSVIQHSLHRNQVSMGLYYIGPMFRAERPQAGRKRQFHQIGAELINSKDVEKDDLKIIYAAYDFLNYLGSTTHSLRVNDLSMMSGESGEKVRQSLRDYFSQYKNDLDEDSRYRLDKNVLRIFDSKDPKTREIIDGMNWDEIAPASETFKNTLATLEDEGIRFEWDRNLVRGLDYYTGLVFEVVGSGLGAQDAVAGGGRYDRLYEAIGGKAAPCTGFSIGMERLMMTLENNKPSLSDLIRQGRVYMAPLVEGDREEGFIEVREMTMRLRELGLESHLGPAESNAGGHIKKALKMGAKFMLLKGPEEVQKGVWQLKNLDTEEQQVVKNDDVIMKLLKVTKNELV